MAIRMNGQEPGNLGPPFRKRQIRHNASQGFKEDAPFDVRTGKDVPLVYRPKDEVALLEVLEIHTDYLVCEGLDPYTKKWMDRVLVAKPYLLQVTPFDEQTVRVEERPVSDPITYSTIRYVYDQDDKDVRVATTTDSAGSVVTATQRMFPKFFVRDEDEVYVRDVISAIRTAVVSDDGSQVIENTGLIARNADGEPLDVKGEVVDEDSQAEKILWLDLNAGARRWVGLNDSIKIGVTDEEIVYNGSGQISVWRAGLDTTEQIEAHLDWLTRDKISQGKEVLCHWFEDESIWRIVGAECEDPEEPEILQVKNESYSQSLTTTFADVGGYVAAYTSGTALATKQI